MKRGSDGFMMLVVVAVVSLLCVAATGLWYTMSLQADVMYEREQHIKNELIAQQVMRQVLNFIKSNGASFFNERSRQGYPLSFKLGGAEAVDDQKEFSVTVDQDKHKTAMPTLLVSLQMLKKNEAVIMLRCLCSQLATSQQNKKVAYVVHHYTVGTTL